ncbi:MAG: bifunctional glutamate--cysteine ligase GshA/glutathione synthetase GshB, partial [Clostridia bacterium]|nr:bifunctional glutamate--cysteine ligase GshA/glutathione synthetase GshB [Clostridia bacterium]
MLELTKELKEKIKHGCFGLEREAIRVDANGVLSHKPHPACFGNKLNAKHITTDFSESQVEMITPVMNSLDELYAFADKLYDFVCSNLEKEYLWCFSMPCIIEGDIPVALYDGEKGRQATEYRKMLVERYGGEKQLISGIHFNFSFTEDFLQGLYKLLGEGKEYRLFVDDIYLRMARNWFKYDFAIAYLCGASPTCHETFDKRCIAELEESGKGEYAAQGVSLRNSKWGYRNLYDLFPSYESAERYVDTIGQFINEGKISFFKEYYSNVRLKGRDKCIERLKEDGIKYIEIRTVDINPFDKVGVSLNDLKFIHIFLLLMLFADDSGDCRKCYQKDGQDAKEAVSLYGIDTKIRICGREYNAKSKILELIDACYVLNEELGIYDS